MYLCCCKAGVVHMVLCRWVSVGVVVEQLRCICCCISGVVYLVLKNVGVTMVLNICCVYDVVYGFVYMWLYIWCCFGFAVCVLAYMWCCVFGIMYMELYRHCCVAVVVYGVVYMSVYIC